MVHLVNEVMSAWVAAALIAGLALGAHIQSIEKFRKEEALEAMFSYLANRQAER
jgi:hypothetical protein